jgi:glutathione S-transferase
MFGQYFGSYIAAALGVIYLIGRMIYFTSYVKDPKGRSMGYGLSAVPVMILLAGAIIGAIRAAVLTL